MWDFLNQNASAVFTLLTFISTLSIPYIFKRSELAFQKKSNQYLNFKDIYVDLSQNIGGFHLLYQEIYYLLTYTDVDYEIFDLPNKLLTLDFKVITDSLKTFHYKTREIYAKSLFIHEGVGALIESCIFTQYKIIYIFERVSKDSLKLYLAELKEINDIYLLSIKAVRRKVLKFL